VGVSAGATANESITLPPFPQAGKYAVAVVGFDTQPGGTVYDLDTWVVSDPSPDDPANAPGLSVSDAAVTAGTPTVLKLSYSGVAAPGTYLGVVTYHQGNAPTTANVAAYSIVELTKTGAGVEPEPVSAPTEAAAPQPSTDAPPAAMTPVSPAAPAPTPTTVPAGLTVRSAKVSGRTLTLSLQGAKAGTVRASVKRGSRFVAKAAAKRVASTVKLTLNRKLARGTYTVKVISGTKTVGSVKLRLAK
jgi:hypothetical protein